MNGFYGMIIGHNDDKIELLDNFMCSPVIERDSEESITIVQTTDVKINSDLKTFLTPNIIEFYFYELKAAIKNIEDNNFDELVNLKKENIIPEKLEKVIKNTNIINFYINNCIKAVIFGYTTLECFINISIPENYIYIKNENKREERYNKEQIERWIPFKEKMDKILFKSYNIDKNENIEIWNRMCELESLRNEIIHKKEKTTKEIIDSFFDRNLINKLYAVEKIIDLFYKSVIEGKIETPVIFKWPRTNKNHIYRLKNKITFEADYEGEPWFEYNF